MNRSRPLWLILASALVLGACSATVRLPPPPQEPRPVVFFQHERHSSLVVHDQAGVPWRFAFGEWGWYVEQRRGAGGAVRALLRDSPAALGRARLEADAPHGWQPQVGSRITAQTAFDAEAARVDALLGSLQARFAQGLGDPRWVPELRLEVVADPQPYRLGHNSNHEVAAWLQALGAQVDGSPAIGRWRVEP